jgi:hypothetical protein
MSPSNAYGNARIVSPSNGVTLFALVHSATLPAPEKVRSVAMNNVLLPIR